MTKQVKVTCGTHRHLTTIPVSSIKSLEDDVDGTPSCATSIVVLRLKPARWIQDTWGDGQWHGIVCADRAEVGQLLFKPRRNVWRLNDAYRAYEKEVRKP